MRRGERIASMSTLKPAKYIINGDVYIVKDHDKLHRVKVSKCFVIGDGFFAECFFIDVGKIECVAYDHLYHLTDALSEIPPQAICFKLFGFDELQRCPRIQRYFSAWLMNKQMCGCLMMAEAQYQVQLNHGIKMPKVSITPFVFHPKFMLYKPILLKQIGESLPKPAFTSETTLAKVSHVSPTGLVYFHVDIPSINYIDTLIQQFVSENQQLKWRFRFSEAAHCVVLIYDNERNMYHRAKIITVESGSASTKYKCYCMDKGETRLVAISDIFGLHENSMLSYFPGQAVPALLHAIPMYEDTTIERLNDILTNNTEVQVKVIDHKNNLPIVTVHKYSLNINELVRMEFELDK